MAGADPARALAREALAAIPGERLARWLAGRRWFGAKGRAPRAARIGRVIPLPWPGGPFALAVLEVELGEGVVWRYQLPLVGRGEGRGARGENAGSGAGDRGRDTHADVLRESDGVVIVDATEDEAFRAALLEAMLRGETVEGDGVRLVFESVAPRPSSLAPRPSRLGAAEQSNSSIIYGDAAILKLFRRLEPGENPDVEIARFLTTRTDFRNTPELLGVARLEEGGERAVAAMLSRYVPSTGDAWSHALERARAYLRAPGTAEPPDPFAAEARELGRVTRALHEALASDENDPAFAPTYAGDADVERWADGAREMMTGALDLLATRVRALDARSRAPAQALLGRRAALLRRLDEIADEVADEVTEHGDAGLLVRHHGDFHLGQVLRTTGGDWMIIDFEGEPARSLEERRARHSPLRDVAGMMRSFAYAAATAAGEVAGTAVNPTVEVRAARWERDARAAFLDGYMHRVDDDEPDTLLPDTPQGSEALLTLFEIEKIFYELSYELNNRPTWAWIPLRGIAKLF
ncbi:MAG TPA: putative maltokinase [Gemmatimonadaceae bacterium]|nr:putative maltokinase [Gemmatimonadaceae bacterium]